jgi:hypothetical protein
LAVAGWAATGGTAVVDVVLAVALVELGFSVVVTVVGEEAVSSDAPPEQPSITSSRAATAPLAARTTQC